MGLFCARFGRPHVQARHCLCELLERQSATLVHVGRRELLAHQNEIGGFLLGRDNGPLILLFVLVALLGQNMLGSLVLLVVFVVAFWNGGRRHVGGFDSDELLLSIRQLNLPAARVAHKLNEEAKPAVVVVSSLQRVQTHTVTKIEDVFILSNSPSLDSLTVCTLRPLPVANQGSRKLLTHHKKKHGNARVFLGVFHGGMRHPHALVGFFCRARVACALGQLESLCEGGHGARMATVCIGAFSAAYRAPPQIGITKLHERLYPCLDIVSLPYIVSLLRLDIVSLLRQQENLVPVVQGVGVAVQLNTAQRQQFPRFYLCRARICCPRGLCERELLLQAHARPVGASQSPEGEAQTAIKRLGHIRRAVAHSLGTARDARTERGRGSKVLRLLMPPQLYQEALRLARRLSLHSRLPARNLKCSSSVSLLTRLPLRGTNRTVTVCAPQAMSSDEPQEANGTGGDLPPQSQAQAGRSSAGLGAQVGVSVSAAAA